MKRNGVSDHVPFSFCTTGQRRPRDFNELLIRRDVLMLLKGEQLTVFFEQLLIDVHVVVVLPLPNRN